MIPSQHEYAFDPTHGYDLETLLALTPPPSPADFTSFWQTRYERVLTIDPAPTLTPAPSPEPLFRCFDLSYRSTEAISIHGWLLCPREGPIVRGLILGHGYGGIDHPQISPRLAGTAYLVPCFRGLARSQQPPISPHPAWHVLHDIDKPQRYILGGCVEDLWLAVSTLVSLFPALEGHLAYLGISFGGGIGALAMPWETRVQRWHFNVPSFGHHPLRLQLPCIGSAAAIQQFQRQRENFNVLDTLQYYDAVTAAQHMTRPVHVAAARFDPAVPPAGQFAIYNALPATRQLFVLDAGHADYPGRAEQTQALLQDLQDFLRPL